MSTRFILALAALALAAFAPAPFPRKERGPKQGGLALTELRGTWRVTKLYTTVQGGPPREHNVNQEVHIVGDQWSFQTVGGKAVDYAIAIDTKTTPAQIDWYSGKQVAGAPYGRGIIRRRGPLLEVQYTWGGSRGTSFENPPGGHWLMTLQRK